MTDLTNCCACGGKGFHQIDSEFYPEGTISCAVCMGKGAIDFTGQKMPYAYHVQDEKAWELVDVSHYYPEIVEYWNSKGIQDVKVNPNGPCDEDCLYLNGQWAGYCRNLWDWKKGEDLTEDQKAPTGKRR